MLATFRRVVGRVADWTIWHTSGSSAAFWDRHYAAGGTSGPGSRGVLARMKADMVNRLITDYSVESVVELGCGDGYQASLLVAKHYTGLDVAPRAVRLCTERFRHDTAKSFLLYTPGVPLPGGVQIQADMALSLDVIFHLVEQGVYERYMTDLFRLARRAVVIYSTNGDVARREPKYTKRRVFTDWIRANVTGWELTEQHLNPYPELSRCGFYVYTRPSGSI